MRGGGGGGGGQGAGGGGGGWGGALKIGESLIFNKHLLNILK